MVCPEPEQPSMADECCGSLECHCIEGYSRFIDHKGKNYNSYYMSHIEIFNFQLFHLGSNTSNNSIKGESKCIESWTCPVGECGENEHWNECGSSAGCGGDDFCCPSGGCDGTGWDPAVPWRSMTSDKSGSRSVKSLRKVLN